MPTDTELEYQHLASEERMIVRINALAAAVTGMKLASPDDPEVVPAFEVASQTALDPESSENGNGHRTSSVWRKRQKTLQKRA